MTRSRIIEHIFFFGFLGLVGYLVWQLTYPFISALALSAIIVTICYPLYDGLRLRMPKQSASAAALLTTLIAFLVVIVPLSLITYALVSEAQSLIGSNTIGIESISQNIESTVQNYIPGAEVDITAYIQQGASWLTSHLGAIFAGTASTLFLFFIAMIGAYYFFKDGRQFTQKLVKISPLPDSEDEVILARLALAVRSVALGTVLIALIQGLLTTVGLTVFGFERAILWGTLAAFGALIPSVGTSIVLIPAVGYLLLTSQIPSAIGLAVWGITAVGLIDNLLGPYLMSRGNAIHPFIMLIAVLGGISFLGPIGFIVGPVIFSLFLVLLDFYSQYISPEKPKSDTVNTSKAA